MSIEKTTVIDFMGLDEKTEIYHLGISDHLDWKNSEEHLHILQEKINKYLAFIEGGQLHKEQPLARGKKILIQVYAKYPLNKYGERFYDHAQELVKEAGFGLEFKLIED